MYVYKKCKGRNSKVGSDREEVACISRGSMQARCKGGRRRTMVMRQNPTATRQSDHNLRIMIKDQETKCKSDRHE